MHRESFDWLKPSLLWDTGLAGARRPDFFQPQLLQFNDDNFVDAFRRMAASVDRGPLRSAVISPAASTPIKLYQPAHGWFYLVTAGLSCRVPGFPERMVQYAKGESVFFVMRKFASGGEYAWIVDGTSKKWQSVAAQPRQVLANEERLPMFRILGSDGRALLVGYVPVASRDAYSVSIKDLNAAMSPFEQSQYPGGIDIRIEELQARFTTPLTRNIIASPPTLVLAQAAAATPSQSLNVSVYMLLDLWEYFDQYLPDVAAALRDNPAAVFTGPLAGAETQLMAFLAAPLAGAGFSLADALGAVAKQSGALSAAGGGDPAALGLAAYDLAPPLCQSIDADALESAVRAALPDDPAQAVSLPVGTNTGETYALRCVYERPQCTPALRVVSQPSAPFQLAAFFDGDAPARPVRIVLPTDVSIAGLRKFNKGVTFLISGALQKKINRITGAEKQLLKDPSALNSEGLELGWMCSFSIQIIFIVAFFLLLMFVIILNLVFWWIAFFKICIPVPKSLQSG